MPGSAEHETRRCPRTAAVPSLPGGRNPDGEGLLSVRRDFSTPYDGDLTGYWQEKGLGGALRVLAVMLLAAAAAVVVLFVIAWLVSPPPLD